MPRICAFVKHLHRDRLRLPTNGFFSMLFHSTVSRFSLRYIIENSTINVKASQNSHRAVQLSAGVNQDIKCKRISLAYQLWLTTIWLQDAIFYVIYCTFYVLKLYVLQIIELYNDNSLYQATKICRMCLMTVKPKQQC